eukprot:jgi/Hompol1/1132/HPOL_000052-RA
MQVDPSRRYFAVAEVYESQPHIYIFEFPSLRLFRVLRNGAERGYSDLCFNSNGDKIASVAIDPDFMLTIWNWKQEKIVLRSKAFSQDVFRVAFSPDNDGILTTSGMGHIKFWRMSSTFTGLKLQGYLGKFGVTELSDIASFIQLPDGKVLSSTETGNMLLWDGGMIKCEISVKGRRPCHQGKIEVILLVEGEVITAGEDGLVRIWDLETIDNADVSTTTQVSAGASSDSGGPASSSVVQSRIFEMEPIDEILIAKDVKIKSVVRYTNSSDYLVQDQQGHLFRLDLNKRSSDKLLSFHAGPVMSVDTSPVSNIMASLGSDGNLRVYDYTSKSMLNKSKFHAGGSCMMFLPPTSFHIDCQSLDCVGNTVIAGFNDGVLRIVSFTPVGMILQNVLKPHRATINAIAVSSDGNLIVTGSEDKSIFLFQVARKVADDRAQPYARSMVKITPMGFLMLSSPVVKLTISPDDELYRESFKDDAGTHLFGLDGNVIVGKRLLIGLRDGSMHSALLSPDESIDTSVTFEIPPSKLRLAQWKPHVIVTQETSKAAGSENSNTQGSTQSPDAQAGAQADKESQNQADGSNANDAARSQQSQTDQQPQKSASNDKLVRTTSMIRKSRQVVITPDSAITAVLYLQNGYFLASFINTDNECEIRLCHVLMPSKSKHLLVYKFAITDLRMSASK